MVPRPRNSKAANYAGYLVKKAAATIGDHGRQLVAETEIVRDVSRMALANDLAYLLVQAERDSSALATWLGLVDGKGYRLHEPYPPVSDAELRGCDFRVYVHRMGREARYRNELCLRWEPGSIRPVRPYTGVVEAVPGGPRRGRIRSPEFSCTLLRRDARDLSYGDEVTFAAAHDPGTGLLLAFLVTKAGGEDEPRSSSRPVAPLPGGARKPFAVAEGAVR